MGVPPDHAGFVLHEAGYDPENEDWNFPSVLSPFWRLYYNSQAGHCVVFGDRPVELTPDRLVLMPDHQLFHCQGSRPVPHAWLAFSVADVLRIIPLSRSTLENRFRASLGRTIHGEIQRVKVEQARQLLIHTDLLIKQIAVRCGFKYVPYLTRVFRQHMGRSPGEYRRQRNGSPNRTKCSD